MKITSLISRFFIPRSVISLYYYVRQKALVSPRAEVELSKNVKLGRGTEIGSFTKVKASDGPFILGDRSSIATNCFLAAGAGGITIGDNFLCGPNVSIIASSYYIDQTDIHLEDRGFSSKGIRIGKNVWIGAGCTILDGAELGDNTVVVANSLVNRKYKQNVILQGAPATVLMKR